MSRVFLVEDEPHARRAVRELLAGSDIELIGEAATIAAARDGLRGSSADVVLLDLELPDGSGLDVLRLVRERNPAPLVIVLTVLADDEHIFEALREGAIGYLLKCDLDQRLIAGLRDAIAGGSPMSPGIARRVLATFAAPRAADMPLTSREAEVMDLLARGCGYDEIGRALGVTTNTIRSFIRSIYEKLHVSNRAEAVSEALRRRLIRQP